jgi:hypothetical protein
MALVLHSGCCHASRSPGPKVLAEIIQKPEANRGLSTQHILRAHRGHRAMLLCVSWKFRCDPSAQDGLTDARHFQCRTAMEAECRDLYKSCEPTNLESQSVSESLNVCFSEGSAARILEKQNSLRMSQVFPFPCIGDQMALLRCRSNSRRFISTRSLLQNRSQQLLALLGG